MPLKDPNKGNSEEGINEKLENDDSPKVKKNDESLKLKKETVSPKVNKESPDSQSGE